jgi:hypothetical protein
MKKRCCHLFLEALMIRDLLSIPAIGKVCCEEAAISTYNCQKMSCIWNEGTKYSIFHLSNLGITRVALAKGKCVGELT